MVTNYNNIGSRKYIMSKHTINRICGHVLVAYFQITNFLDVQAKMNDLLPTHPELKQLSLMITRYFTLWNVLIQVIYAFLALLCDVTSLAGVESNLLTSIRKFRLTFFSALVFPMGAIVTVFWPIFIYDRSLILPAEYDIAISKTCNFLWHASVQLYILWELAFLPRDVQKPGYKPVLCCEFSYLVTILYTRYVDIGSWPYAFLKVVEGTPILPLLISTILAGQFFSYFLQWHLKDCIWRWRDQKKLN